MSCGHCVRAGAGVAIALMMASIPAAAFAQEPEIEADAEAVEEPADVERPEGDSECFPKCRAGYLCHEGRCVEACNPPCPEGERCTESGECVPKETAPPRLLEPSPATAAAPPAEKPGKPDRYRPAFIDLGQGPVLCVSEKGCNTKDGELGVSVDLSGGYRPLPWLSVGIGSTIGFVFLDDEREPKSLYFAVGGRVLFTPLRRERVVEPVVGLGVGYALQRDSWKNENGTSALSKLHGMVLEYIVGVDFKLWRALTLGVRLTVKEPLYFTSCIEQTAGNTVDPATGSVPEATSLCSKNKEPGKSFLFEPGIDFGLHF